MPTLMGFIFLSQSAKGGIEQWKARCGSVETLLLQPVGLFYFPCPVISATVPQGSGDSPLLFRWYNCSRITVPDPPCTSHHLYSAPIHISSTTAPPELQIPKVTKQMLPAFGLQFFLLERKILIELRILKC